VSLKTIVKCTFEGHIKLHSGLQPYRVECEGENISESWLEAMDLILAQCEAWEGVLIGVVIMSADASREEIETLPFDLN